MTRTVFGKQSEVVESVNNHYGMIDCSASFLLLWKSAFFPKEKAEIKELRQNAQRL